MEARGIQGVGGGGIIQLVQITISDISEPSLSSVSLGAVVS